MGNTNHEWRLQAACAQLNVAEADALFFPGSGGKPHKAKKFCETNCQFRSQCLVDAIENKLSGYFAGTTDDERMEMARWHHLSVTPLPMPPEPDRNKRTIYRALVTKEAEDHYAWMDSVEPSEVDLLRTAS